MNIFFWIIILAIISVVWAYYSMLKERQRHEIEKAKKEMETGRVIFHSSDVSESKSSL
jgi:hypothetical protein